MSNWDKTKIELLKSQKEAHDMHMMFLATVGDFIDALNDYFERIYGKL